MKMTFEAKQSGAKAILSNTSPAAPRLPTGEFRGLLTTSGATLKLKSLNWEVV